MWNYCENCRSQWHTKELIDVCDVCHTADPLHSEYAKLGDE